MKTNTLQEIMEAREKIEFVSEILRLIAKELPIHAENRKLTLALTHLREMLDSEAIKLSILECELSGIDELKEIDALREVQNGA